MRDAFQRAALRHALRRVTALCFHFDSNLQGVGCSKILLNLYYCIVRAQYHWVFRRAGCDGRLLPGPARVSGRPVLRVLPYQR